nr:hypothetical protein HmN_000790100 [Hymenolepis microstoma]
MFLTNPPFMLRFPRMNPTSNSSEVPWAFDEFFLSAKSAVRVFFLSRTGLRNIPLFPQMILLIALVFHSFMSILLTNITTLISARITSATLQFAT